MWLEHLLSGDQVKRSEGLIILGLAFFNNIKPPPTPPRKGRGKGVQLSFNLSWDESAGSIIPPLGEQEGGHFSLVAQLVRALH